MKKTTILIAVAVPAMLAAAAGGYYAYLTKKAEKPVVAYSDEGTVVTRKQAAVLPDNIDEVVVEDESKPEEHDFTEDMPDVVMPFAAEYYAGFLSEDEETVCRQLYQGLCGHEESIRIKRGVVSSDDICDLIVMCVTSSPDIDYLDPNYSVTVDGDGFVSEVDV
ncbi:MAG: transglutaminase, partial [Oscillospiraceae bacterium]|nr:transglutaminase [Oscillospiraceae bacterium]